MESGSSSMRAAFVSIMVFVVLVFALVYVYISVDLRGFDVPNILYGVTLFAISLLTVVVYQSFKISENAKHLATRMAKNIVSYSHELFSELYRGSPVPYILIDERGNVTSANPSTARLFNCSQDDLEGKNIFQYIEGDDVQRIALIPEKLKQGLFVNDEEARILRADGGKRWVLLSLFSFKDTRGARNGLLTLVDITKQKEIDKAKTEFVSLASHQLRTPISAMKWNIELLTSASQGTLTALQKDYLSKVGTGVARMENLINDFLSASKFELGTLTAEMKKAVLEDCLMDIIEEQYERARSRGIEVRMDIPEEKVEFMTDTHLFNMAIGNLISNAIKYTKEGGMVSIRAVINADHLVISISDTGIGVPADEQEKLFGKIFRASNARTQVPEGTGLGLYITREAIVVLGGEISFVSKEGVGTTFTVVLPLS